MTGTLEYEEDRVPCINASMPPDVVVEPQIARALTARGDSSPCVDRKQNNFVCLNPWDTQNARIVTPDCKSPTLVGADGGGGRNPGGLVMVAHPEVAGTLCASGAGLNRPVGQGNETDLVVAYCLQGNMIDRAEKNGPEGGGVNTEICFTLNTTDRHAVASNCVIRRLTPTECERLMSLPDNYTKYGYDGKEMSDTACYRMCGNSVVVNVLAPIMQNIAAVLSE